MDKKIKRYGCVGGWYSGISNNPSFKRGILKGLVRTIKAEQNDSSIVCKVKRYKK